LWETKFHTDSKQQENKIKYPALYAVMLRVNQER